MPENEPAIRNRIKTYFTLYSVEEKNGEVEANSDVQPMRYSDCSIEGTTEKIESDVVLPGTRIPSTPELGSESNSGSVTTEWNIDEQDSWFAGAFCGDWVTDPENARRKVLTLGDANHSFCIMKKYTQKPVAFQCFKKEFINQLSFNFATNSFVKLTWDFQGSNNPPKVVTDPLTDKTPVYLEAGTTKSFLTRSGFLKYGDDVGHLKAIRQSPSLNITINNNLEKTPGLFETESIENTLGYFNVSGTMDVYNADDTGNDIYNDAVAGKDKVIQVSVTRTVNGVTTTYTLTLNVHLDAPSESKNGNKLQFSVPFTLNAVDDFQLEKVTEGDPIVVAETPVFDNVLSDVTYLEGEEADLLDGTATVQDGGRVRYSWKKDGTEVVPTAKYKPDTSVPGVYELEVTATNRLGESTASAKQSLTLTVTAAVDAETPVFGGTLADATYTTSDTPVALDGTASVQDGGTVTYQWYAGDTAITGETGATYTPDVSTEGATVYKVVATNTNSSATGSQTATAEMSCTITVAD